MSSIAYPAHPPFSELFRELAGQHILSPKEVAFHTRRSISTVYRWLRGETAPGVDDLVCLLSGVDEPIRARLLNWLVQDVPVRWESVELDDIAGTRSVSPEAAARRANTAILDVLNMLAELLRDNALSADGNFGLTAEQAGQIQERITTIMNELVGIRLLQKARLVNRKAALRAGLQPKSGGGSV